MNLFTSPLIKVFSGPENVWFCVFINSSKIFSINRNLASLIVFGIGYNGTIESLVKDFAVMSKKQEEDIQKIVLQLLEKKIFISHITQEVENNISLMKEFEYFGWQGISEYHFSTMDYEFMDYTSSKGFLEEDNKMRSYFEEEEEIPRFKSYETSNFIECLSPHKITELEKEEIPSIANILKNAISFSLGIVRQGTVVTKGGDPLVHKVVPSGGSRHPTEAYLIANNISGLDNGIYHFNSGYYRLERIKTSYSSEYIENIFFSKEAFLNFEPKGIIVLSSIFERNMFRYREPRTFRSIHMDAGHIIKVLEEFLGFYNLRSKVQYNMNETLLENFLELPRLKEGIMASIAIG